MARRPRRLRGPSRSAPPTSCDSQLAMPKVRLRSWLGCRGSPPARSQRGRDACAGNASRGVWPPAYRTCTRRPTAAGAGLNVIERRYRQFLEAGEKPPRDLSALSDALAAVARSSGRCSLIRAHHALEEWPSPARAAREMGVHGPARRRGRLVCRDRHVRVRRGIRRSRRCDAPQPVAAARAAAAIARRSPRFTSGLYTARRRELSPAAADRANRQG